MKLLRKKPKQEKPIEEEDKPKGEYPQDIYDTPEEAYNSPKVSKDFDIEEWERICKEKDDYYSRYESRGKTSRMGSISVEDMLNVANQKVKEKTYRKKGFPPENI